MEILLLSTSTVHGSSYLEYCTPLLAEFLRGRRSLTFVPYALHDHDAYAAKVRSRFAALNIEVNSVHEGKPADIAAAADALFVGGGNTFRLLDALYRYGLLDLIREKVRGGTRYIGSSAGSNVACATIKTTNDMPIVQPPSFEALGLFSFNLNPHYLDPDPSSTHMGETRGERINQFHEENAQPVVGLREGAWLQLDDRTLTLGGSRGARLFRRAAPPKEFEGGADLTFLLDD